MPAQLAHPETRALLARAEAISRRLGSGYVAPGHVVLAAAADERASEAQPLRALGMELGRVRAAVERMLRDQPANPELLARAALPITGRLARGFDRAAERRRASGGAAAVAPAELVAALLEDGAGALAEALRSVAPPPPAA